MAFFASVFTYMAVRANRLARVDYVASQKAAQFIPATWRQKLFGHGSISGDQYVAGHNLENLNRSGVWLPGTPLED